jgi:hypothetical protein
MSAWQPIPAQVGSNFHQHMDCLASNVFAHEQVDRILLYQNPLLLPLHFEKAHA